MELIGPAQEPVYFAHPRSKDADHPQNEKHISICILKKIITKNAKLRGIPLQQPWANSLGSTCVDQETYFDYGGSKEHPCEDVLVNVFLNKQDKGKSGVDD